MKPRTKITVTLAVGVGLLVGSMGVASASPHYTDWWSVKSVKAPVTSIEEVKVASLKDSGRLSGFTHHANIDSLHQEVVSFESGPVRPLA